MGACQIKMSFYEEGMMNYTTTPEEISLTLREVKILATMTLSWSRPVCRQCEFYDFNKMSDESYCIAKDYEPIRLYRKHRPDWCPRLNK